MEGIYVPFWLYDYKACYDYTGEGVRVRTWTSGNTEYTEQLTHCASVPPCIFSSLSSLSQWGQYILPLPGSYTTLPPQFSFREAMALIFGAGSTAALGGWIAITTVFVICCLCGTYQERKDRSDPPGSGPACSPEIRIRHSSRCDPRSWPPA